jgi:hypothetical protein
VLALPGSTVKAAGRNSPTRSTYYDAFMHLFIVSIAGYVASGSDLAQGTKYPEWDFRAATCSLLYINIFNVVLHCLT